MQINLIQNVLRKRTAQRYRHEPTTPVFTIYLVTTIMLRRTITRYKKSISGKIKWSLRLARDFICQASEFDKLLGADPQEAQGGHRLLDLRRSVVNTIY